MRTLICLLSDQLVPNLLSCKILNPERILLVETEQMKKKEASRNFLRALGGMGISIAREIVEVPEGKDNDFPSLKTFFREKLLVPNIGDTFFLNITGGTKPMSIALYETFRDVSKADFFYFDVNRPNEIIDFLTNRRIPVGHGISMEAFLAGYGFEFAKDMQKVCCAESFAAKRKKTTRIIARHCDHPDFRIWDSGNKEALAWRQKMMNFCKKEIEIPPEYLKPTIPEVREAIAKQFRLQDDPNGCLVGTLSSWDIRYLDGGWLEEFIWGTLKKYSEKYGLNDLHLGIEVKPFDNNTRNELDVSFMRNNMLYVMECKTGFQEKMQENAYKIFAVTQQLKALRTKAYLIANSASLEKVRERAKLHQTTLIDADQIAQMAKDPEAVLNKLFQVSQK
ncbi:MAG: DUF1887 family protein [Planctomycetaceae bacterium]|nr:DUF1887 family protein [Planctomycetaceae bacterium]